MTTPADVSTSLAALGGALTQIANGVTAALAAIAAAQTSLAALVTATPPAPLIIDATKPAAQNNTMAVPGGIGHFASATTSWAQYNAVDFGGGSDTLNLAVAQQGANGFAIHLGSLTGPVLTTITPAMTASWSTYTAQSFPIPRTSGVHNVFFVAYPPNTWGSGNLQAFSVSAGVAAIVAVQP